MHMAGAAKPSTGGSEVVQSGRADALEMLEYARFSLRLGDLACRAVQRDPHDDARRPTARYEIGHLVDRVAVAVPETVHCCYSLSTAAKDGRHVCADGREGARLRGLPHRCILRERNETKSLVESADRRRRSTPARVEDRPRVRLREPAPPFKRSSSSI